MSGATVEALLRLGVESTLVGADPTNEREYTERMRGESAHTLPPWSVVVAELKRMDEDTAPIDPREARVVALERRIADLETVLDPH
jgi:hypothetical protein